MDVKDVKGVTDSQSNQNSRQRNVSALSTKYIGSVQAEAVKVNIENRGQEVSSPQVRGRLNDLISMINVTAEASGEIEKLVKSIDGITSQASDEKISTQRREILENEANELVEEIRKHASFSVKGVRPLSGDPIRIELEEKLGRALDMILPKDAEDAFGLGEISFTPRDSIINVRTAVARAQGQIEQLRKRIDEVKDTIAKAVEAAEVAYQNTEAAQVSIRDVDEALRVAGSTRFGIVDNPESALNSVGELDPSALQLLRSL